MTWEEMVKKHNILTDEEITEIEIKNKISSEIINARAYKKMTQKQLEEITGMKQPFIARLEKGDVDMRLSTLIKITKALGLKISILPNDIVNIENNTLMLAEEKEKYFTDRQDEIDYLMSKMAECVYNMEFEKAIEIRDRIKNLKDK